MGGAWLQNGPTCMRWKWITLQSNGQMDIICIEPSTTLLLSKMRESAPPHLFENLKILKACRLPKQDFRPLLKTLSAPVHRFEFCKI